MKKETEQTIEAIKNTTIKYKSLSEEELKEKLEEFLFGEIPQPTIKALGYSKQGHLVPIEETPAFHEAMKKAWKEETDKIYNESREELDQSLNKLEEKFKNG